MAAPSSLRGRRPCVASASHARASRPSSLNTTAQASSSELMGATKAAASSSRSAGRMVGCPGLAWLPLALPPALCALPRLRCRLGSLSCLRWLPLCLIGYVRRPTMSSLRRLLDESGASSSSSDSKRSVVRVISHFHWESFGGGALSVRVTSTSQQSPESQSRAGQGRSCGAQLCWSRSEKGAMGCGVRRRV